METFLDMGLSMVEEVTQKLILVPNVRRGALMKARVGHTSAIGTGLTVELHVT
jgi:hypothetical protein